MEGTGKKIIISDLKKKLSSSKSGESDGNAKQTIFLFLALPVLSGSKVSCSRTQHGGSTMYV